MFISIAEATFMSEK